MISFNLINYNNGEVIDEFVEHFYQMANSLEHDFEVVVVDNWSDDDSWKVLKDMSDKFRQVKSDRGHARNVAHDMADGQVFVDQLDTDQEAQPELADIINWYCENMPDYCINTNGVMVNGRDIVTEYGFGEFQSGEDKYLWDELIMADRYKFLDVNTAKHLVHNHERSPPFYEPAFDYPDVHRTFTDEELKEEIFG